MAGIRRAAIDAFRGRGLSTPLEDVADAAGVSKGTIYNHFGGRDGLIDAVIDELVADKLSEIEASVATIDDPFHRLYVYLMAVWWSAYYEPVVADVLAATDPTAPRLAGVREQALELAGHLVAAAHRAGQLRDDLTVEDVHYMVWSTALAIKHGPRLDQGTFRRRAEQRLEGMRAARS